ncbi:ATP-binding protein [Actinokineospora globicatena]|uniref:ATP-binding protein n=1 Tax=Actinokineospora globicatena TaxID=103729 RepID=UPI0020A2831E|nr:ATP-binding protein [Actinokineospora globicatena]MCP2305436.1 ATP-dependent DNA helicase RecG [Actinokineospora globicatena]GLW81304.1 transcriptional regulator [Actinokineospora globicatena]GLW87998.1 transcriptional regulator [Actinokineospora globicatena]
MPLSDNELERLFADLESDRVERKESAHAVDKIGQAVCAFANDLPGHRQRGVLFIGVKDNGDHAGLVITDQLLQNLASLRDQGNLLPPPSLTVRKVVLGGRDLAVVEVEPSTAPPVRYKGQIWIRVGPRRGLANGDDERRLNERRRSLDAPFDVRPLAGATLTDLDQDLFTDTLVPSLVPPAVLAANGRTTGQRMAALRLTTAEGVPTAAGLLTVGRDPLGFLPGAYIQFLRVAGQDLTDPIVDEKRLDGPLPTLLSRLDELLTINIRVAVDITGGPLESRTPDYPVAALQQIVRNAVMHRTYEYTHSPVRMTWYQDRIEVVSPGGPFGVVTTATFGNGITDYRNPTLADMMHGLGYVQRFGAGIPITRKGLADNGNPPPEFEATESHVAVTIRGRS